MDIVFVLLIAGLCAGTLGLVRAVARLRSRT